MPVCVMSFVSLDAAILASDLPIASRRKVLPAVRAGSQPSVRRVLHVVHVVPQGALLVHQALHHFVQVGIRGQDALTEPVAVDRTVGDGVSRVDEAVRAEAAGQQTDAIKTIGALVVGEADTGTGDQTVGGGKRVLLLAHVRERSAPAGSIPNTAIWPEVFVMM